MKAVKAKMAEKNASAEDIAAFEKGAQGFAKKIVGSFKDPDGMVVLMNYREDGTTPFVTLWKHGLSEMKV
jgi:hypothetical protein